MSGVYTESAAVFEPGLETFAQAWTRGKPQVVWTRLVADLETPVSAYMKLAQMGTDASSGAAAGHRPMSFLLESVEGGINRGRYSMIGVAPDLVFRANGERAEVNRAPLADPRAFAPMRGATLTALRTILAESAIDLPPQLPPMSVGVFGYMGYDTVRLVEHLPNVPPDALGVPDALLMRPTVMVVFDAVKVEMTVVTPVYPEAPGSKAKAAAGSTAAAAYDAACDRLRAVVRALDDPIPHHAAMATAPVSPPVPVSNVSPATYMDHVRKAKEYVAAGDVFQLVLSQRFSAPFTLPPFALYRALRRTNPSPFLFHLELGAFALVGSSPEILVRVRDGEVTIRPLAGTRPRGATDAQDKALEQELIADPKERAEHLMLLDLGRNDVGRVAEIGSVRVTEKFVVERYSHVMHLSSHVVGKLDQRHDIIDALMAGFPAGTLSGAPKVRAMEIIDEMESVKRGPYAGCVGYFSADGQMDTCIVLRTALVKDGVMHVQAGAGVVADSVPEAEQAECEHKARALFKAAEEAHRIAGSAVPGNR